MKNSLLIILSLFFSMQAFAKCNIVLDSKAAIVISNDLLPGSAIIRNQNSAGDYGVSLIKEVFETNERNPLGKNVILTINTFYISNKTGTVIGGSKASESMLTAIESLKVEMNKLGCN